MLLTEAVGAAALGVKRGLGRAAAVSDTFPMVVSAERRLAEALRSGASARQGSAQARAPGGTALLIPVASHPLPSALHQGASGWSWSALRG